MLVSLHCQCRCGPIDGFRYGDNLWVSTVEPAEGQTAVEGEGN